MKKLSLDDFYTLVSPYKATKSLLGEKTDMHSQIMEILINKTKTIDDIKKDLDDFKSSSTREGNEVVIEDIVQIYNSKELFPITKTDTTGTKIGVVLSKTPKVSLNVRNVNKTALFLNTIPSLEFSKCVPYVDLNFQFGKDAIYNKKSNIPNNIRFLNGNQDLKKADMLMLGSTEHEDNLSKITVSETDMSIFTLPQSCNTNLVYNESSTNNITNAQILDQNRPFLSLSGITINVAPTLIYATQYKTAKVELILHDKSRLHEISELLRPNLYGNTKIILKYGWNHPDDINENPYSELINTMKLNEIYNIQDSSYSLESTGQVKITLSLSMRGESEMWISKISENPEYIELQKRISIIRERIYDLFTSLGINVEPETRAYQIMNFVDKSVHADISGQESQDLDKKIKDFINSIKNKKDKKNMNAANELSKTIDDFIKGNKKSKSLGMKEQLKNTVQHAIAYKMDLVKTKSDIFLPHAKAEDESLRDIKKYPYIKFLNEAVYSSKNIYQYVSLAKLFSIFVLQPLQQLNKFTEIQMFFYPFNGFCGYCSNTNIGNFPISVKIFEQVIKDYFYKKRTLDMSVASFIKLIIDAFISDPSSVAYGMKESYVSRDGIELPKPKPDVDLEKQHDAKLRDVGASGAWKNPSVAFLMECLPKEKTSAEIVQEIGVKNTSDSILRIHIYDKNSSPWESFQTLKKSKQAFNDAITSFSAQGDLEELQQAAKRIFGDSVEIKQNSESKTLVTSLNPEKLKALITNFVPTLYYGTNNSGILHANIQTQHDARATTNNMVRNDLVTSTEPNNSGVSGIPMQVMPGNIDISLIGCPLLHINQHFFIDFFTNTSIDNFYGLTELNHTIAPGKFETSAKFTWHDAYGSYSGLAAKLSNLSNEIKSKAKVK